MSESERRQPPDDDSFFDDQLQIAQDCHDRGLDFGYAYPKDIDRALEELDQAIRMRESLLGKYNNDTALSYFRKASILREDKHDYFSALVVARRELRISFHLLGGGRRRNDSPIIDECMGQEWLTERVQWIQEVLFQQQRHVDEREVARYSSQLLQTMKYERLGDHYYAQNDWNLAITQYDSALALESSAFARNLLEMADIQVKIADCYAGMNDFDAAMEEYKNAQMKYQDQFGIFPHTTVGHLLNKCATLYLKQKDFDSALGAYAKAYSIFEQVLGKKHKLSVEALQDIRLVTVKEMEALRQAERLNSKKNGSKIRISTKHRERTNGNAEIEDRSYF